MRALIKKKSHRKGIFARSTCSYKVFHALNSRNLCKTESRPFWKQRGNQMSKQKRSLASSYHLTGYPRTPHFGEEQTAIVFRQHSIVYKEQKYSYFNGSTGQLPVRQGWWGLGKLFDLYTLKYWVNTDPEILAVKDRFPPGPFVLGSVRSLGQPATQNLSQFIITVQGQLPRASCFLAILTRTLPERLFRFSFDLVKFSYLNKHCKGLGENK